ncbi:hypothetical protein [Nocardia sp. alder85J]|uniref:hypothetical protein n=1 Tax=Nocardia sp. alder85J TaxID=2862949 RepID=UPI001CD76C47|nr:hypothetical protein [Nocardia sp. alder85J]MCX4097890.1 hypothetical protein [Nocardia sp. alder85J]
MSEVLPGTLITVSRNGIRQESASATQDPGYAAARQRRAGEVLAQPDSPVFDLIDRNWVARVITLDPARLDPYVRVGLDHVIDLHTWVDMYAPTLQLE